MGRQRVAAVVVGVSILAAGGGWYAGTRITSPDEARTKTRAPTPSLITAPVEMRKLSSNLVLRGDLAFEESTPLSLTGGSGATGAVVTKSPPEVGTSLVEGQALTEVSGRPLIILQGDLPAFRTLGLGMTGDDILQLETALKRLGFKPGTVDSTFDAATQAAVTSLYRQRGYATKEPSREQREALSSAQSQANFARESLRTAQKAAKESAVGIKESERLGLENAVVDARAALAQAQVAVTRSTAEGATLTASAEAELKQTVGARDLAVAKLAEAQAPGAVDPATGAPYAPSALAKLRNAVVAANDQITAKQAGVATAKTAAADLAASRQAAAGAAQRTVDVAVAARVEGLAARATTDTANALAESQRNLTEAEKRLAEATSATGVTVPSGELVFLKALPRRIDATYLRRGDAATGKVVDVSGADLTITTSVSVADRSLVSVGTEVQVTEDSLDIKFKGLVTKVADQPGTTTGAKTGAGNSSNGSGSGAGAGGGAGSNSGSAERYAVVIAPGQLPADVDVSRLQGVNFKITIPVKSTAGEVLAVPVAALSATPDGGTRIEVAVTDTTTRFVRVRKGLAAQGYVEISAEGSDRLSPGDQVVVGK